MAVGENEGVERAEVEKDPKDAVAEAAEDSVEAGASEDSVAEESARHGKPWYRRPRNVAVLGLVAVGVIAAVAVPKIAHDREAKDAAPSSEMINGKYKTIADYLKDGSITSTPARRGEPGTPKITMGLPPSWTDAGVDTPEWAYAEAVMKGSSDPNDPGVVDVLLSKLSGDVDQAKILDYAPGELRNLPNYSPVSEPDRSTLSGFEAVQLGGLYSRDGQERIIAQKTVVIPTGGNLFVLQINADAPKADAQALQQATAVMDDQAKIVP